MWGRREKAECRKVRGLLSEYMDGTLAGAGLDLVRGHLERCDACRHEYEGLRTTVDMLRRMPVVAAPRSFALSPEQVKAGGILSPRGVGWLRPLTGTVAALVEPQNVGWLRPATALAVVALIAVLAVDFVGPGGGMEEGLQVADGQTRLTATPTVGADWMQGVKGDGMDLLSETASPAVPPVPGNETLFGGGMEGGMELFTPASSLPTPLAGYTGNGSELIGEERDGEGMPTPIPTPSPTVTEIASEGGEEPGVGRGMESTTEEAGANGGAVAELDSVGGGGWPVVRWVEIGVGVLAVLLLAATGYAMLRRQEEEA